MKNVNDLNSFLNEKRVTVKRRYTEAHPAKNVSTAARVRSSILEAIADGHITEEEMTRILSELKAHKRWLSRNKGLFNISEDQAGIKTFSLSPYGLRVKNKTTILNEALNVPHKEKGKKPVNMFVGRFQPFTLGHVKVFEKMYKENGLPVVVYMVRGKKPDPEKRPFDEDMQQAMFAKMKKQYPFLEASFVVSNGAIDTMFAAARPAYEPMMWGYGTDRKKDYGDMIDKQSYRDQLGVDPSFKGYEIPRTGENISASKVRNALKIDDEKSFKKMTPKSIHGFYKTLQNTLQPIKENNNMKNLKSLSSFGINEAKYNKKSLMKAMKKDDGMVQLGTGEEYVNEAKKLGLGDKGVDYNDNVVEIIEIGKFDKVAKRFKKEMKADAEDYGFEKGAGEFYLTKNIEATEEGKVGDLAIYPVKYDMSNYWGLDPLKESINEEYIELMQIDKPLEDLKAAWDQWKSGPATNYDDVPPAFKELQKYVTKWLKKNLR
jgi:cytidyltransferase-like protein